MIAIRITILCLVSTARYMVKLNATFSTICCNLLPRIKRHTATTAKYGSFFAIVCYTKLRVAMLAFFNNPVTGAFHATH